MLRFVIFFYLLAQTSWFVFAEEATVSSFSQATGFNNEVSNRHRLKPSDQTRPLTRRALNEDQQQVADRSAQLAQNASLLSILLIERGQIIYEKYNLPAREDRWFMSWSMSKSLTAYTLGTAFCKGKISSLNIAAGDLSPELKGTVYADSLVRDILMMASGAKDAQQNGEHHNQAWSRITQQVYSGQEYLHDFGQRGKGFFGVTKSGTTFSYKNIDTLALESVVESNGGFIKQFEENIWSKIGAERSASWMLDKSNRAVSFAGFTAHTRDWARLAMWSIDQIKGDDLCMRKYMRDATNAQISNYGPIGKSYKKYGYQTWIGNFGPRPSYWWVGYGGQRVGVDPENELVIVVSSWREDYMDQIHDLFGAWQRKK